MAEAGMTFRKKEFHYITGRKSMNPKIREKKR